MYISSENTMGNATWIGKIAVITKRVNTIGKYKMFRKAGGVGGGGHENSKGCNKCGVYRICRISDRRNAIFKKIEDCSK